MSETQQALIVVAVDPTGHLKADRKVFDRAAHLIRWIKDHLALSVEVVRQNPKKGSRRLWLDPDLAESVTVRFRHSKAALRFENAMMRPAFQTFVLGPRQSCDVISLSSERAISDASESCRKHLSIVARYLANPSLFGTCELADSMRIAEESSLKAVNQIIAQLPGFGHPSDEASLH